ncbi:response regulator [Paenibacillus sp. N3.4]|uniref:response regulator n=1 Tax=Paenibacillus sp. N3.4 TaxID=2603222 RepID=UPI0011C9FBD4|nr:response regulator [Paenibacillus sp. N3.4]TXK85177.1 response regulator [Paenibacillus sp. N3.4]
MIRMIIVDDEPIERIALQKIIEEGSLDIEVVGQASNGREAIEAAVRLQPDLITMDIKMPGINGLQAIEKIKESNASIKFIIVTAFDTFEFAQQAIRLGVYDYMLKPSRISVVLETIGKVANKIKHDRIELEHRSMDKQRLQKMMPLVEADIVEQLLFDYVPLADLNEMIKLLDLPNMRDGFVMNVLFSSVSEEDGKWCDSDELYSKLVTHIHEFSIPCWIGKMSGKQVQIIVFMDGEQSYRAHAISFTRKLLQALSKKNECSLFVGVGGICREVREMRRSYHEALLASLDTSLPSRYCLFEDIPPNENLPVGTRTLEMEKNVLEAVRRGDWELAGDQLAKIIDMFEGIGQQVGMAQQRIFEILIVVTKMLEEMGLEVSKPYFSYYTSSYMQLKAETRILINNFIQIEEVETNLLLSMKQYIRKHAHEDLSLEKIAATVNRNPFYVSKLFKEHVGMNYIDFLTEFRIETAKQLMQETDKSLKEITFEVGYNDPNYFSRVFKKLVGHSPTDYRKMLLRPANKKQI